MSEGPEAEDVRTAANAEAGESARTGERAKADVHARTVEHAEADAHERAVDHTETGERTETGQPSRTVEHPGVQRVLQDMEGLEQHPVGEHAAVYQDAHERLTRELDSAESRIAGAGGGSGGAASS